VASFLHTLRVKCSKHFACYCVCYRPHQSHPPWFVHQNNIGEGDKECKFHQPSFTSALASHILLCSAKAKCSVFLITDLCYKCGISHIEKCIICYNSVAVINSVVIQSRLNRNKKKYTERQKGCRDRLEQPDAERRITERIRRCLKP